MEQKWGQRNSNPQRTKQSQGNVITAARLKQRDEADDKNENKPFLRGKGGPASMVRGTGTAL